MTPSASDSRLGKLGLTDRIFAGARSRRLLATVDEGMLRVDAALGDELRMAQPVVDAVSRYLYEAGGKRVRPMLALLTAQLGDGTTDAVVEGAAALELTHLGSLYHDDVMDDADKRRGVPAAHEVWGNSVAILAGDLLFARASQIMARYGERAIRIQADTFERLVLGQMRETVGPAEGDDPVQFSLDVLADKTGSLIAASAQVGNIFANGPEEFEQPLAVFGEKAGVAFQLLDDVIDLAADPAETGKVPGTDLRAGVPTMPYLVLTRRTDADSVGLREEIDDGVARIAAGADPAILDHALARLRDHEATQATRDLAGSYSQEAIDALEPLPDGAVREALTRFARAVADRSR
ncbi:polyprenyl synthetase family protein [Microbacterium aurantiacum]|uniref:Geranylgeranyl pyrophosphate synthase n=1 Tax=Microbacterium aurantiacum TaxID=162393 RepID=A0A0M8MMK3_9MICO|nr:polyprenyl synthetase family protein [Microbacterium chocolatum]ANG84076.1 geranylgeranyl pyrophosphate synthase [Microbacterium chocolatum]KOS10524.1 geranylgeranyl pyrophosphate synthase [Microbacterium chocolatum]MBN9200909.1 polyprenyl synthetase family protein [Microbacterium chocolatum]ODT10730.1 MAG: geranylgeranyl pyrophosphate synthase [Microbacterium sp. SCN 70-18]